MYEKVKETTLPVGSHENKTGDNSVAQKKDNVKQRFRSEDNRPEAVEQRKLRAIMNSGGTRAFDSDVIQARIKGSGRKIKQNESLNHGSVAENSDSKMQKPNNVRDGPAWFTAHGDY